MSHHPSDHMKTSVELTETELMVLIKYYVERIKQRRSNPNVISDYGVRMSVFDEALKEIADKKEAERKALIAKVGSFRTGVGGT